MLANAAPYPVYRAGDALNTVDAGHATLEPHEARSSAESVGSYRGRLKRSSRVAKGVPFPGEVRTLLNLLPSIMRSSAYTVQYTYTVQYIFAI